MQFPITLGLHPSRFLRRLVLLLAALAAALSCFWPQPWPWRLGLVLGVALMTWRAWRQLRQPWAAVRLERSGVIGLQCAAGGDWRDDLRLLPGSIVHPWLSVLYLKNPAGGRSTVVLAVDSLEAGDSRRLRVFTRWQAAVSRDGTDG